MEIQCKMQFKAQYSGTDSDTQSNIDTDIAKYSSLMILTCVKVAVHSACCNVWWVQMTWFFSVSVAGIICQQPLTSMAVILRNSL